VDLFDLNEEQRFDGGKHVEKILSRWPGGDATVACWEPGQISPEHCHPYATEIYFCYTGGGRMRTPEGEVEITPGRFVIHPPGELHEYVNGPARTLLFRVRIGEDMTSRNVANRGVSNWTQSREDAAYFADRRPE
jgi:quercetin dioxygenase-like cupin family protein